MAAKRSGVSRDEHEKLRREVEDLKRQFKQAQDDLADDARGNRLILVRMLQTIGNLAESLEDVGESQNDLKQLQQETFKLLNDVSRRLPGSRK
jgi:hypothetical protein